MKKSLSLWQFTGFIFTGIIGALLHFTYSWSNESIYFAPFSAVNESIWEHMKLLFFPMFIFSIVEYFIIGDQYENFWPTKLKGILLGSLLIPIFYYTYSGIIGKQFDLMNIIIFYIADATAYIFEYKAFRKSKQKCYAPYIAFIILCVIALIFVIFTFITPTIPLFKDASKDIYGINK